MGKYPIDLPGSSVYRTNDFLITGASNIPLSIIGRVNIRIKFDDCECFQTFIIVNNFKHKLLLGKDFLIQRGAVVNYSKKLASLQMPGLDGYMNVHFQDPEPIKLVNAYKSLELEASSVTRLAFKLDGEVEKGQCVAVEGGFLLNEGLYLPGYCTSFRQQKGNCRNFQCKLDTH